jgi:fructose-1,6-bisphosphatase/inositol monophosphatase family enzyme
MAKGMRLPESSPVALTPGAIAELTGFLRELMLAAGRHTLAHFRMPIPVANKSAVGDGYDPVTEADRAAESAMRELIAARYPDHGIYGEEHGF